MSLPNTSVPKAILEVAGTRPLMRIETFSAVAVEGVSTQSDRGNRELSSPALWNRHLHHRPVQRHFREYGTARLLALPVNDTRRRV